MDWDINEATVYVLTNTLDNEDFMDAEDVRKIALLNVSSRELQRKFSGYTVPNKAVYLFANTLASAFNDTNKMQQQGIASFSIKGMSFTFKDWAKKDIDSLIPPEVYALVSEENGGVQLSSRAVKWTVL